MWLIKVTAFWKSVGLRLRGKKRLFHSLLFKIFYCSKFFTSSSIILKNKYRLIHSLFLSHSHTQTPTTERQNWFLRQQLKEVYRGGRGGSRVYWCIMGEVNKKTTGSIITDVKYNSEAFNHWKNERKCKIKRNLSDNM